MAIAAGEVFRMVLDFSMPDTQKAQNVLAVRCDSGTCTDAQFLTAAGTFITGLYGWAVGIIHNNVTLFPGTINEVIWTGVEWQVKRLVGIPTGSTSGLDGTDMLPHATAAVITLPTATPKKFGRVFVPGLTESNQNDSLLTAGAASALSNLAGALLTPFTAAGASFSYKVIGKGGNVDTPTGFAVNGVLGSRRSRKPGVGI